MPFVAGGGDLAGSDDIERDRGWTRRRVKQQIEILTAFLGNFFGVFYRQSRNKARCLCTYISFLFHQVLSNFTPVLYSWLPQLRPRNQPQRRSSYVHSLILETLAQGRFRRV